MNSTAGATGSRGGQTRNLHWTLAAAGAALAASQVAGVVARIVWGYVSDRWLGPRRLHLAPQARRWGRWAWLFLAGLAAGWQRVAAGAGADALVLIQPRRN